MWACIYQYYVWGQCSVPYCRCNLCFPFFLFSLHTMDIHYIHLFINSYVWNVILPLSSWVHHVRYTSNQALVSCDSLSRKSWFRAWKNHHSCLTVWQVKTRHMIFIFKFTLRSTYNYINVWNGSNFYDDQLVGLTWARLYILKSLIFGGKLSKHVESNIWVPIITVCHTCNLKLCLHTWYMVTHKKTFLRIKSSKH